MKTITTTTLITLIVFFSLNINAQIITTIAGTGVRGYSGDGGPATAAKLGEVDYVAVDANNNLYIGDRNWTVRKVDTAGIISTFAGIADSGGYSGDGGPATAAKITYTLGIAIDKKGNVYISDNANHRIRKVDTAGIITTFAGNGSATISGDNIPATAAGIGSTKGICFDVAGNLYIAVANQIRKVDTLGVITVYAGTGINGYSGDGAAATNAQLAAPAEIQMDVNNNLYIADEGNWRIRKVTANGVITTIAGNGTQGYGGDGNPATSAKFDYAGGVFPDKCSNVYIADYENERIRMINGKGIITTIAGNGHGAPAIGGGGYSGDGGAATNAEFNNPETVYLDNSGNIYIADELNYAVRYIQMDGCVNVTATPGLSKGEEMVRIYPNPVDNSLTVSNPSGMADEYSIKNLLGQQIMSGALPTGEQQIDVSSLGPGNYVASFYNNGMPAGNTIFVKK